MTEGKSAKSVAESWFSAIESKDPEKILGFLSEDVTIKAEIFRSPIRGKEPIRALLQAMLGNYESIEIEREQMIEAGSEVAALVHIKVKLAGDLEILGTKLPTAGKRLNLEGALFLEVGEDGKISSITRVQDLWNLIYQLGLSSEQFQTFTQKLVDQMEELDNLQSA
jgi:steroid delta-isomerase-like uncharacterized protein